MNMEKLMHVLLFTPLRGGRWGLPGLLLGVPGDGKTDRVGQFAARCGLPCVALSPGTHGEGAFGVVPVPYERVVRDVKRMLLGYPPPEWLEQVLDGGVVFLDELTSTPQAQQPPLLGIFQARQIGFSPLPGRCRVLAAGNPVDLAAGGHKQAPAVANRMGWFDWNGGTETEWGDWLISHGGSNGETESDPIDAKSEEARVLAAWPAAWARSAGLVRAFHVRHPGLLTKVPAANDPARNAAWPSRRTWEFATRGLASSEIHGGDREMRETIVGAFVGGAARDEFFAFADEQDIPDPGEALDGKVPWKHDPRRLDITVTMISSCCALVLSPSCPNRDARVERIWQIIGEMDRAGEMDVSGKAATKLSLAGLGRGAAARKTLAQKEEMLKRAGMKVRS